MAEKIFLGEYITQLVSDYMTSFPKEEKKAPVEEKVMQEIPKAEPGGIASELEKKFDEMMSQAKPEGEEEVPKRKLSAKKSFSLPKI